MLELMNMAILEVNAQRRVERIAADMRDARHVVVSDGPDDGPRNEAPRPAPVHLRGEPLTEA